MHNLHLTHPCYAGKKNRMTVFIHIGAEKCGSTTIQQMFKVNYGYFLDNNILIPKGLGRATAPLNHARIAVSCYENSKNDDLTQYFFRETTRSEFLTRTSSDFAQAITAPFQQYFFSCEHFSSRLNSPQEISSLRDFFRNSSLANEEIKIVLVIRDQYDWHLSAYNTFIKCGGKKTLGDWLKRSLDRNSANWFNIADKWSKVFGVDSIIILPLHHKNSSNSLEKRFLEACSVPGSIIANVKTVDRQNIRSNPSLLEKIRLINLQHDWMIDGKINQYRTELIEQMIHDSASFDDVDSGLCLDEVARSIYLSYSNSNIKLVEKFALDPSAFDFLLTGRD